MKKADRISDFVKELASSVSLPGFSHDPRYLGFFTCFNRGDYYEAHDVLEDLWLQTTGPDYAFYKGLIQIAGAFVHLRKQQEHPGHHKHGRRMFPATRLFHLGLTNLAPFAPRHHGLDLIALHHLCARICDAIRSADFQINPWNPRALPQIELT